MSGDYGAVLRNKRTAMNLSLRVLAQRAQITASHLLRIERGQSEPSLGIAARLCDALELSLDDLAGRKPPNVVRAKQLLTEALVVLGEIGKPPL